MFATLKRWLTSGKLKRRRIPPALPFRPTMEVLEDRELLAAYYWNPLGATGNWSAITHWRIGSATGPQATTLPSIEDSVHFTLNKTCTVEANTNPSIADLNLSSGFALLNIYGTLHVNGNANLTTGDINLAGDVENVRGQGAHGPGTLMIHGGGSWRPQAAFVPSPGGAIDGIGSVRIINGAQLIAENSAGLSTLFGRTNWYLEGQSVLGNGSTLTLKNTGDFRLGGKGSIFVGENCMLQFFQPIEDTQQLRIRKEAGTNNFIINEGTIWRDSYPAEGPGGMVLCELPVINTGSIVLSRGDLSRWPKVL